MRARRLVTATLLSAAAACGGENPPEIPLTDSHAISEGVATAADGTPLYYRVLGRAPDTLLALHGGPGETQETIGPELTLLLARHALVVYDQRGNGRSGHVDDSTHISIAYHVADVDAVRTHLGLTHVAIIGHSWGGDLAALYAAAHPDAVTRLVLADPGPPRDVPYDQQSRAGRFAGIDAATRARIGALGTAAIADTAKDKPALCQALYGLLLKNYFADSAAKRRVIANECGYVYSLRLANRTSRLTEASGFAGRMWDTLARKVTVPVLVVHGDADFLPVASSVAWASAFPNGRLLIVPRGSHYSFSDRPDVFFPAVEEFLAGGWPATAKRPEAPPH